MTEGTDEPIASELLVEAATGEYPETADFDTEDLISFIDERTEALSAGLSAVRGKVAKAIWSELGVQGLSELFSTIPQQFLEPFLRDFHTPAPRRPARPDAETIARKGRSGGPKQILDILGFLGQSLRESAYELIADDASPELDEWRAQHSDAVIRAALTGEVFGSPIRGAHAIMTLESFGLLSGELAVDPETVQQAAAIQAAVIDLATREEEEVPADADGFDEEADDPDESGIIIAEVASVNEMATGLITVQPETLDDLHEQISDVLAHYKAGAPAARSIARSFEDVVLPNPRDLEYVYLLSKGILALVGAIQPTLDHLGLPGMPPLDHCVEAIALARGPSGPRMAELAGPPALEERLATLRQAAEGDDTQLTPFLAALEHLIDVSADDDADHLVLHRLEETARALDPEGRFSAMLVAAIRGELSLPAVEPSSNDTTLDEEVTGYTTDTTSNPEPVVLDPLPVLEQTSSRELADLGEAKIPESTGVDVTEATGDSTPTIEPERVFILDESDEDALDEEYSGDFDQAIAEGKFGLAAWTAEAIGAPSDLLHLANLARAVRTPRGPLVDALMAAHLELAEKGVTGGTSEQLTCWASTLQAAVVAPESGVFELAESLADMLRVPGAVELTAAVVHFARRGVSLVGPALSAMGSLAELEEVIATHAGDLFVALGLHRYRFGPATRTWTELTRSGGVLAELTPGASDDRSKVPAVRSAATRLSDRRTAEREIASAEKRVRERSSTKRIEGSAKQDLLRHFGEATTAALAWCDAVEALDASQRRSSGAEDEVAAGLHQSAARVRDDLLAGLDQRPTPGAVGARLVLDDLYDLMSGTPLAGTELSPELARHEALLFGDQPVGADLAPFGKLDPSAVVAGRTRSIELALSLRAEREDFVAAKALIDVAKARGDDTQPLERVYAAALEAGRAKVRQRGEDAARILDRARRQLYVSEDDYAELSGRQARAIDEARLDIGSKLAELDAITDLVASSKATAIANFCAGVADVRASDHAFASRVDALIDEGDLATAIELVQLAERGEDLGQADREAFVITTFFPAVPDQLTAGIDDSLVDGVKERKAVGALDFSSLTDATAASVVEAFEAWRDFSSKAHSSVLPIIKPVLRLMGIEADGEERKGTHSIPSSPQRRWFDLTGVTLTGKALLPFFGSASRGRLRCLNVAEAPGPEALCEWIEQDLARLPTMVLHPGTMTAEFRLSVARILRRRGIQAVVIVDDAVLGWLGARAEFRFEPLMAATLPFSSGNPYLPPSGDCPIEMFYGRSAQVADVQAQSGTCLVYGGRQLGKSALLRTAQREFNRVREQKAIYVDLKHPVQTTKKPEVVWSELMAKLTEVDIMKASRTVPRNPAAAVSTAVNEWLDAHETGRILVLLDESDDFFDLDAQANFATTSLIKDLMDARGRRFKVVWTGLHQVRRFATVSNHPIAHLGVPAVIGYLEPGPAFRLIERPCAALGLRFASDALVNRVLAYCNYQPVLLHLFGQALVARMCHRQVDSLVTVPIEVCEVDVEEVADSPALKEKVREKMQLTLELDPRYKVITYTAAYEAHEHGEGTALSAPELRTACEGWWPAGFANVDAAEFRSLLDELVGLGVLSADRDGRGWRLRSANVLRLLGTHEQIEDSLFEEEEREPTMLESSEIRERLPSGGFSPITRAQLNDLIGTGSNQVRIVIGSEATCAERLREALTRAAETRLSRFTVVPTRSKATYKKALGEGGIDEPRLVFADLRGARIEACVEAVTQATAILPWNGSRAVVLLVDATTVSWWLEFADPQRTRRGVELLALRRFDRLGGRAWAATYDDVFQDEESRRQLLKLTGGWPALVSRAEVLIKDRTAGSTAAILAELEDELKSDEDVKALLCATLTGAPRSMLSLFELLAENAGETMGAEDLAAFINDDGSNDPVSVIAALRALGVLRVGVDGGLGAEPVMASAWLRREHAASTS